MRDESNNQPAPDDMQEFVIEQMSECRRFWSCSNSCQCRDLMGSPTHPNSGDQCIQKRINAAESRPKGSMISSLEFSQKNHALQKYLELRQDERPKNTLDQSKPYIKVTVIKNISFPQQNSQKDYYINEHGLIDTAKNTTSRDILIGRQSRHQVDGVPSPVYPNDIVLPETDRVISRIHCKLICEEYFRQKDILDDHYQVTLRHLRLPRHVKLCISQFLVKPRNLYIQDLGSIYGTHLRVHRSDPYRLEAQQMYSIGSDTHFEIQDCFVPEGENLLELDAEYRNVLSRILKQKVELHPTPIREELAEDQQEGCGQLNDELKQLRNYKLAFIVMKFNGGGVESNKTTHMFVNTNLQEQREFLIGRAQDNHVKISSNTISRKQTRFFYSPQLKGWYIADGCPEKDSANGTWVSLSTTEQKQKKEESNKRIVRQNAEIKISDFILKIELFQKSSARQIKKWEREELQKLIS